MRRQKPKKGPGRPRETVTAFARWLDLHEINRDDFARRLKVHRSTIDRLANGSRRPDLDLCARIIKATKGKVDVESWLAIPIHVEDRVK